MGGVLSSMSMNPTVTSANDNSANVPINVVLTQDVFDRWQEIAAERATATKEQLRRRQQQKANQGSPMVADDKETFLTPPWKMERNNNDANSKSSATPDSPIEPPSYNVKTTESGVKKAFLGLEQHDLGGGDQHVEDEETRKMSPFPLSVYKQDGLFRPKGGVEELNPDEYLGSSLSPPTDIAGKGDDLKTSSESEEHHLDFLKLDLTVFGPKSPPRVPPPFIPDVNVELPEKLSLNVLTNMAKDCLAKLPEVESLKSSDFGEIHTEIAEKCQKVNQFWTSKLDSKIGEDASNLDSDMINFLARAERVKGQIPTPVQNSCAKFYENIAHCYSQNKGEVFKCHDLMKEFATCVGQNDWSAIGKRQ